MKRSERETLAIVTERLEAAGLAWTTRRGKHLCVVVTAPDGSQHSLPISGTPRDPDALKNFARQQAARLIDRLGLLSERPPAPAKPRPHRRNNHERVVYRFEPRPPGRLDQDPFAILAALRSDQA